MIKLFVAVVAVVTLSLPALALAPAPGTGKGLFFSATIHEGKFRGAAFYEEYTPDAKVTQVLTIRITGGEPNREHKVGVNNVLMGYLRTNAQGNGRVRYTNPPGSIPIVRAGSTLSVRGVVGDFVSAG